jgi:hypothetical protein
MSFVGFPVFRFSLCCYFDEETTAPLIDFSSSSGFSPALSRLFYLEAWLAALLCIPATLVNFFCSSALTTMEVFCDVVAIFRQKPFIVFLHFQRLGLSATSIICQVYFALTTLLSFFLQGFNPSRDLVSVSRANPSLAFCVLGVLLLWSLTTSKV